MKQDQLFFYILSGPYKGTKFAIKKNLTIGGEASQVNLKDKKLSKIHAQIIFQNNSYFLFDSNSKNGVWVNNRRIKKIELFHGLQITLGDCILQTRNLSKKSTKQSSPVKVQRTTTENPFKKISHLCKDLSNKTLDRTNKLSPLNPTLVFKFINGIQTNTLWHLGYGPRKIGSNSMDLPIFEDNAPEVCFEVIPSKNGVLFKTSVPKTVLINGQAKKSSVFKDNDTIAIGDTHIKVNLS